MTVSDSGDDRVIFDIDPEKRIATIELNNPKQRNSYDAAMREAESYRVQARAQDQPAVVRVVDARGRHAHGDAADRIGQGDAGRLDIDRLDGDESTDALAEHRKDDLRRHARRRERIFQSGIRSHGHFA